LDLPLLVKESLSIQSSGFIEIVEKARSLLSKEKGDIGNLTILDRLVKLEASGEALVIGDLHGDIESLNLILQSSQFIEKMHKTPEATLIFLGDYGDRGEKSPETYYLILKLKLTFPRQIVLLRGNHEAPKDLLGIPHDLPISLQNRFGEAWKQAYEKIRALHDCLYNAVYVEDQYLMLHAGLSPNIKSIQDIEQAKENYNETVLEDILWNDPDEKVRDVSFSPRGLGKLFGKKVTNEVLECLNAKILIRGHETSNMGFKTNHGGKVLTLFSRKGAPYFNRYGAYLHLPLTEKFEKAKQLTPFIHKF
jgi:protein phosphatase